MKRLCVLATLLALLGAGFAPPGEWEPKEFPVSFWCGPPDNFITTERYREIAEAGFNYVMPPCEGRSTPERNKRILDAVKPTGLKAFLLDERMPAAITGVPDAKQRIDAIVADFSKHPAFAGYFIGDEPGAKAFAGHGEVVAYLREKDPKHPAYLNLYPNYASPVELGAPTYDAYVEQFIQRIDPFIVSYDHYHFMKTGDRPGFFSNLAVVRDMAAKYNRPFWQIVLAVPHGNYRPVTEAEKRWEAMQTLAYGGKGVMFFTYWQPNDPTFVWGPPIIDREGKKTPQYEEVKRINADVKAIGKYLLYGQPVTVFQAGNLAPGGTAREPGTPVRVPSGDVTVGLIRADTHLYVLFANRDYKQTTTTDAILECGMYVPERLNKATGKWLPVKGEKTEDGDLKTRLELAPGDGELYRW
jgi:hypothetical protein